MGRFLKRGKDIGHLSHRADTDLLDHPEVFQAGAAQDEPASLIFKTLKLFDNVGPLAGKFDPIPVKRTFSGIWPESTTNPRKLTDSIRWRSSGAFPSPFRVNR
jgi:hypothetical protein